MRNSLLITAVAVLSLSSCSTITHTTQVEPIDTQIYNVTVADMDVSKQKQSATTEWSWSPFNTFSLSTVKENAEAKLLEQTGGDVLVEPQFEVHRRGLFRGGSVTVTGYPATYSNFRPMTASEADVVALANGKAAIAATAIATTAQAIFKPVKKKPVNYFATERYSFVNILGGANFDYDNSFDTKAAFGLMYGNYGRTWGWYAKAMLANVEGECYDYDRGWYDDSKTGFTITGGVMKTFGRGGAVFVGTGVGTAFSYCYDSGGEKTGVGFCRSF